MVQLSVNYKHTDLRKTYPAGLAMSILKDSSMCIHYVTFLKLLLYCSLKLEQLSLDVKSNKPISLPLISLSFY